MLLNINLQDPQALFNIKSIDWLYLKAMYLEMRSQKPKQDKSTPSKANPS